MGRFENILYYLSMMKISWVVTLGALTAQKTAIKSSTESSKVNFWCEKFAVVNFAATL